MINNLSLIFLFILNQKTPTLNSVSVFPTYYNYFKFKNILSPDKSTVSL